MESPLNHYIPKSMHYSIFLGHLDAISDVVTKLGIDVLLGLLLIYDMLDKLPLFLAYRMAQKQTYPSNK